VKPSTRLALLTVITIAWFALAVVNFSRANVVVGLAYSVCGLVVALLTFRLSRGRRSR